MQEEMQEGSLERITDYRVWKACVKWIPVLWKTHSLILQLPASAHTSTNQFLEGLDFCSRRIKAERSCFFHSGIKTLLLKLTAGRNLTTRFEPEIQNWIC